VELRSRKNKKNIAGMERLTVSQNRMDGAV